MPLPRQSSISAAAWRKTGSGKAAGPALKLKTRVMKWGSAEGGTEWLSSLADQVLDAAAGKSRRKKTRPEGRVSL